MAAHDTAPSTEGAAGFDPPHPGSQNMPPWNGGELVDAPVFTWKNWLGLLGPGLLMGGAAIGGGEWLMGPAVTARYGGAVMWLATLSILGQVVYNIEISRYALYSGEPIFTGKFRTLPGPMFWLVCYLVLDFGAVFPYLAANAATPIAAIWLGEIPDSSNPDHKWLLKGIGYGVFLLCFVPLVFGGKIYSCLKAISTFKIVVVLGFLTALGVFFVSASTWQEIFTGFVQFGNVPVQTSEDRNFNGKLDPGERDWDGDGHADRFEQPFPLAVDTDGDGDPDAFDFDEDGSPEAVVELAEGRYWPDFDGDGEPDEQVIVGEEGFSLDYQWKQRQRAFVGRDTTDDGTVDLVFFDHDGDGRRDGDGIDNVFASLFRGDGLPDVDLSMIAFLAAFAAIAGSGGLSNTPISNYTRDQGWGMGHLVGAIPSMVGGRNLELSHVGTVFEIDEETLPKWRRWYRHVMRDQLAVWLPACLLGIALPSMLSVEFLPRGTTADQWTAAGMTADAVGERVSSDSGRAWLGHACWLMTLFCGFLVLAPAMATTIDGFVRRWVDVFWTSSASLREWHPKRIRNVYFATLCGYGAFGLVMLTLNRPMALVLIATNLMNFALGFSCWHTVYVNHTLLPREIRPGWFVTGVLVLAGFFFWTLAILSALRNFGLV